MTSVRAWLVFVAEVMCFAAFFYFAAKARDLYIEIANIYELGGGEEEISRFAAWHGYARTALMVLIVLWLYAISIAAYQFIRVSKSRTQPRSYRPAGPLAASLTLPFAGILIGFIFNLFLPGL
jgi:hypothetical protein